MDFFKNSKFWLIVGAQHLYGEETLRQVAEHAKTMAAGLNESRAIPSEIILQPVVTTPDEITATMMRANQDPQCAGVICWMHTFSPSKMWIGGLSALAKPYCHLHTQFGRNIPDREIDMDFMNLNQSAHGDREHGFIAARLRMRRKIVVGYWADAPVQKKIGDWMRSCVGAMVSRSLKVIRFGDNMREVAVTEGDKVEAQLKLGWQVNTWPVGDLVELIDQVTDEEIDRQMESYQAHYTMDTDDITAVRYQAREEIAIRKMLISEGAGAYSNTFQDLHGMKQLPGLASQDLLREGYGYGGEGDWKVSAMTHIMKCMAEGMTGGTAFMEDYTYDLEEGNELSLGAHMLEVCPTLAADKPAIRVFPLGIGDRQPPARLVFEGHPGEAIVASLVDMGGRMRLIVQDVEAVKPIYEMPNLPVARVMWKAYPNFREGAECWILAGGAHHSVFSYDITAEMMEDWAEIMDIEYVHIGRETNVREFKQQLFLNDLAWKLR